MTNLLYASQSWVDLWGANIWRASYQGGVVLAIAWAFDRWGKFLSQRVICWIWRLACLKLFVALIWAQPVAVPLLPAGTAHTDSRHAAPAVSRAMATPAVSSPDTTVRNEYFSAGALLFPAWLAFVVYRVCLTAGEWRFVRRICQSSEPIKSNSLQRACAEQSGRLGILRCPELRCSSQAKSPLLAGIRRPVIVLPDRSEATFDEAELRLILGHELAHLKRRDLLWNWLPTAASWFFCFHPLVWVMTRRWAEAQEGACDELLIECRFAEPTEYGRLLLKLASQWPSAPRGGLIAAGVLGTHRNLERRILKMANVNPSTFRRTAIAVGLLIVVSALGIVPWRLVAQQVSGEPAKKMPQVDQAAMRVQIYNDTSVTLGLPIASLARPIAEGKLPARSAEEVRLLEEAEKDAQEIFSRVDALYRAAAIGGEAEKHAAVGYALARAQARAAWAKGKAIVCVERLENAVALAKIWADSNRAAYNAGKVTFPELLAASEAKTSAKLTLNQVRESLKNLGVELGS